MLRSTLSTGFLHDPQSGGNPGPAANSAKPDGDGHRACPMTHGEYGLPPLPGGGPVLAIGGPDTGHADRDRSTRTVIWLDPSIARSRHLGGIRRQRTRSAAEVQGNDSNLPRANRLSPSATRATVMITTPARIAVT